MNIFAGFIAMSFVGFSSVVFAGEPTHYGMEFVQREVRVPASVTVKTSKKEKIKELVTQEKFVKVSSTVEDKEKTAFVPYDRFIAQVRAEVQKDGQILEKQEQYLEKSLDFLKAEQQEMLQEHAYYSHQLKHYRWSSLKPVVDGEKKAKDVVAKDIQLFQNRILKLEEELKFIKRKNGVRLSQEDSVNMIIELVSAGYWSMDPYPSQADPMGPIFQKVGQYLIDNPV